MLGSHNIAQLQTSKRALLGLGYVPQARDIFNSLTVEENLFVGLKRRPRADIEEAYQLFPRLKERRAHIASRLSGGEQQVLSTARAILGQPRVLLLDEPLEGLAPVICDELMRALNALALRGIMTIVLVEQQIERALDFANYALILERGRNVWCGASSTLLLERAVIERHLGVSTLYG